eukprot:s563_g17.t1
MCVREVWLRAKNLLGYFAFQDVSCIAADRFTLVAFFGFVWKLLGLLRPRRLEMVRRVACIHGAVPSANLSGEQQ